MQRIKIDQKMFASSRARRVPKCGEAFKITFVQIPVMTIDPKALLTVTFTLFAIIDIVGSIPILIAIKEKVGGINELRATLISGALMILFLYAGEAFLNVLGLDV